MSACLIAYVLCACAGRVFVFFCDYVINTPTLKRGQRGLTLSYERETKGEIVAVPLSSGVLFSTPFNGYFYVNLPQVWDVTGLPYVYLSFYHA